MSTREIIHARLDALNELAKTSTVHAIMAAEFYRVMLRITARQSELLMERARKIDKMQAGSVLGKEAVK